MAGKSPIIVILGPTAAGKSAIADEFAGRMGGEILSVDSMQVYRGMNIGTAKPTAAERTRVVHHLLDVAEPNERFTVSRFVTLADATIANAAEREVHLIATGGTPLYYKALFHGLFDGPPADVNLREQLGQIPQQVLHERLVRIDPAAAAKNS